MFFKNMKLSIPSLIVTLVLSIVSFQPVRASTPSELSFTIETIYSVPSASTVFGAWLSTGILTSSGDIAEKVSFSGWNEDGWFVKNAHTLTLLSDDQGTIAIKSHLHEVNFEPFGPVEFTGDWVIVEGTGVYSRLKGQGSLAFAGMFYWSCPANGYGVTGACIVETKTYTGQGHLEP